MTDRGPISGDVWRHPGGALFKVAKGVNVRVHMDDGSWKPGVIVLDYPQTADSPQHVMTMERWTSDGFIRTILDPESGKRVKAT